MMVVVVVLIQMVGAAVRRFAFGLQPILLGMSLRTAFLLIDGVSLLGQLVMRRLGFGLIFGCVVVFFHRKSPVVFREPHSS